MNDAIRQMLGRYRLETLDDHVRALREILQELALLGLWRSKFFEHAAFYGGTALRVSARPGPLLGGPRFLAAGV